VWQEMIEGCYAGQINALDCLTFKLIPSLHNYRNQIWQDIHQAGTGWETASKAFARIGAECLCAALIGRGLRLLPQMQVGFSRGGPPSYFHIKYGINGVFEHAIGDFFAMDIEAASAKAKFFILLPVLFRDSVLAYGKYKLKPWTCLTAALRAWGRGLFRPW
jgi:hypothetical protein